MNIYIGVGCRRTLYQILNNVKYKNMLFSFYQFNYRKAFKKKDLENIKK